MLDTLTDEQGFWARLLTYPEMVSTWAADTMSALEELRWPTTTGRRYADMLHWLESAKNEGLITPIEYSRLRREVGRAI